MKRNVATILRNRNLSRSLAGDIVIMVFLVAGGLFMALPLVYAIGNAFKPLDELFLFPPAVHPPQAHGPELHRPLPSDGAVVDSAVPLLLQLRVHRDLRAVGQPGDLLDRRLRALQARFPRQEALQRDHHHQSHVLRSGDDHPELPDAVLTGVHRQLLAIIVPAWAQTLGLYLMKKFIDSMVHDSLVEAARIDGAGELTIFARIVMPIVKPAWLTLIIINFQVMWRHSGDIFIYSEQLKPLPYALSQVAGSGIARVGAVGGHSLHHGSADRRVHFEPEQDRGDDGHLRHDGRVGVPACCGCAD